MHVHVYHAFGTFYIKTLVRFISILYQPTNKNTSDTGNMFIIVVRLEKNVILK